MWIPQSGTDVGPNAIPATYSFRVEVVTVTGSVVSTSSSVVWTSSAPGLVSIDPTGLASASVNPNFQANVPVTITAATTSLAGATVSTTVNLLAGNSGTLYLEIN